jgi:hypothetical protein
MIRMLKREQLELSKERNWHYDLTQPFELKIIK